MNQVELKIYHLSPLITQTKQWVSEAKKGGLTDNFLQPVTRFIRDCEEEIEYLQSLITPSSQ